jgi:hypothetical protein
MLRRVILAVFALLLVGAIALAVRLRTPRPVAVEWIARDSAGGWELEIRTDRIRLARAGTAPAFFPYAAARTDSATGISTFASQRTAAEAPLVVLLRPEPCGAPGEDGRVVAVRWARESWEGCARRGGQSRGDQG